MTRRANTGYSSMTFVFKNKSRPMPTEKGSRNQADQKASHIALGDVASVSETIKQLDQVPSSLSAPDVAHIARSFAKTPIGDVLDDLAEEQELNPGELVQRVERQLKRPVDYIEIQGKRVFHKSATSYMLGLPDRLYSSVFMMEALSEVPPMDDDNENTWHSMLLSYAEPITEIIPTLFPEIRLRKGESLPIRLTSAIKNNQQIILYEERKRYLQQQKDKLVYVNTNRQYSVFEQIDTQAWHRRAALAFTTVNEYTEDPEEFVKSRRAPLAQRARELARKHWEYVLQGWPTEDTSHLNLWELQKHLLPMFPELDKIDREKLEAEIAYWNVTATPLRSVTDRNREYSSSFFNPNMDMQLQQEEGVYKTAVTRAVYGQVPYEYTSSLGSIGGS